MKNNELKEYLNSIVDKRLNKEEQEELIEMLSLKDKYGRIQKKISTLNAYLNDNFNMQLISKSRLITINGKRKKITEWEISYK